MNSKQSSSPVSLSYVAALRGVRPRRPGETFAYADVACADTDLLTCLAASNPEERFSLWSATQRRWRGQRKTRVNAKSATSLFSPARRARFWASSSRRLPSCLRSIILFAMKA